MITNWQRYDPSYVIRLANDKFRRQESIRLYREVIRVCRRFTWTDPESGVEWGRILRASARAEFDSSKEEKDPEVLARALVNARMALDDLVDKFQERVEEEEHKERMKKSSVSREDKVASPAFLMQDSQWKNTGNAGGNRVILPTRNDAEKEE